MNAILRLIRGGQRTLPRFRLTIEVDVDDEAELERFVDQQHRRWFTDEHAEERLAKVPDLGTSVAEALVVLNQNPPRIGLDIQSIEVERID